ESLHAHGPARGVEVDGQSRHRPVLLELVGVVNCQRPGPLDQPCDIVLLGHVPSLFLGCVVLASGAFRCFSSTRHSARRNATRSSFSSAVSCAPRTRLKNSTVSSRVNRRPSW